MVQLLRKKSGFTLVEVMLSLAILSIMSVGIMRLFQDGGRIWNYGTARMALDGESRMTMVMMRKFIQECQGASIKISRINNSQPVNSYLEALLAETVYTTTTQTKCGCGTTSDVVTVGSAGQPVKVYQYNNYLLVTSPAIRPGTDLTDNSAVQANTYYRTLTISANIESLMFTFLDAQQGTIVTVGARFSKKLFPKDPPLTMFLKDSVVIKHQHEAGYYYNN